MAQKISQSCVKYTEVLPQNGKALTCDNFPSSHPSSSCLTGEF